MMLGNKIWISSWKNNTIDFCKVWKNSELNFRKHVNYCANTQFAREQEWWNQW